MRILMKPTALMKTMPSARGVRRNCCDCRCLMHVMKQQWLEAAKPWGRGVAERAGFPRGRCALLQAVRGWQRVAVRVDPGVAGLGQSESRGGVEVAEQPRVEKLRVAGDEA